MSLATQTSATDAVLKADLLSRRHEWFQRGIERVMQAVAGGVVLMVLLIFIFIGKECLPVLLGLQSTASAKNEVLTQKAALALAPDQLARYLGQPVDKIAQLDPEMISTLIDLRASELEKSKSPAASVNGAALANLVVPRTWGVYARPEFIWQPNSNVPKFNIVPLLLGTARVALVAMLVAVPLALGAALYVSQIARPAVRETVKPVIELLAGFPSVVIGFFMLIVCASVMQQIFGYPVRLNVLVAGIGVGLAIIPVLFTISEDAFSSVPKLHKDAALAMGATNWHASISVIVPAALPGVFAAGLLSFGRALGETMIALMASGNASLMDLSLTESGRTIPATIGAELAETVFGGVHYQVLFLLGTILFLICFLLNLAGDLVIQRLKARLEGTMAAESHDLAAGTLQVPAF